MRRCRRPGGCSIISRSIIAAPSPSGRVISAAEYTEMREFSASVTQRLGALPAHQAKARAGRGRPRARGGGRAHGRARRGRPDGAEPGAAAARRLSGAARARRRARSRPRRPALCAALRLLPRRHRPGRHGDGAPARSAADRLYRPRPRPRPQPVRPLPGDRPGAGGNGDGELRQPLARGSLGARFLCGHARLSRSARPRRRGRLARQSGLARPHSRSRAAGLDHARRPWRARSARSGPPRSSPICAPIPRRWPRRAARRRWRSPTNCSARASPPIARGDRAQAGELALAAYLDGFEPVEALLSARDGGLVAEVEEAMGRLRAAIARGAPVEEVAAEAERIQALFTRAEAALAPEAGSAASIFLGALAILLREGLEALLIVIAMIGFLQEGRAPRHAGLRAYRLDRRARRRRRDLVGGEPVHHHQRRQPRADRGLRLAARRRHPALRRRLDARQGAGRRLAGLCPRQARQGADQGLRLVPRLPGLHRRLSRGVRDDHLLRGDGRPGQWRRARRRHRGRHRLAGADRLGDAAALGAAADRASSSNIRRR